MRLVQAEILKLVRRRGTMIWCAILTVGSVVITEAILITLHAVNGGGRPSIGFREAASHRVVDMRECHILRPELFALVARVASDLRSELLAARTIRVKIKDADFTIRQAGRTLPEAVVSDRVIYGVARELLHSLRTRRRTAARLIGVALSGLAAAA